ncbi:MAG: hypothetical protein CMH30_05795 [Micavibrio sp.]|nr:hypothetical protein [Micavibrio sp.]|tara:strand:+ start:2406 stop:2759 length:354 start_codon:yes stop_codon:yes gene_type:complete
MKDIVNDQFLSLADALLTLLCHENNIMLQKGTLTLENYMGYKTNLLQKFDQLLQCAPLESLSPEALETVKNIQSIITLNTSLQQAQSLHISYENAALEEKIFHQAGIEKKNRIETCH